MQKISIIGCCGAGKSTLFRQLNQQFNIPITHLDQLYWKAGWVESSTDELAAKLQPIYQHDAWIIDGNFSSTMQDRLSHSDTVFFLDYSTALCFYRVLKRVFLSYGKVRDDCAPGCPERIDFDFLLYVLKFRTKFRQRIVDLLDNNPQLTVHQFTHPRELKAYLQSFTNPCTSASPTPH